MLVLAGPERAERGKTRQRPDDRVEPSVAVADRSSPAPSAIEPLTDALEGDG